MPPELDVSSEVVPLDTSGLPLSQFEFVLPRGLLDGEGTVHRQGIMRLATAADELAVGRDRRAREEPVYATLLLLSRSIISLGTLPAVSPTVLENLYSQDLGYLREVYNRLNQYENLHVAMECPQCRHAYEFDLSLAGES